LPKLHAVAFAQSVNHATPGVINPVADDLLNVRSGDTGVRVPVELPVAPLIYFGGAQAKRGRLSTAWLQKRAWMPDFQPVDAAAVPSDLAPVHDMREAPLPLVDPKSPTLDVLQAQAVNDSGGATVARSLMLLSDGPVKPVSAAGALPVRWSATFSTSAADAWQSFTPTFDQTLAPGVYDILGVRCQAATGVFWRLAGLSPNLQKGLGEGYRPGGLCMPNNAGKVPDALKPGALGVLARFRSDSPPTLELLASSAAAQSPSGLMYLRQVA
jgi:hypothetical protein